MHNMPFTTRAAPNGLRFDQAELEPHCGSCSAGAYALSSLHPTSMTTRNPMVSEGESEAWPRRAALRQSIGSMA
jgi:hypothetical protein